ncbi:uncharacterized protein [Aegilops tauschii subsp. strangulata]|uniref:uncharacterized protein n=1 Tax=Aegilops tauschii subsp. strangulata TaxID=200361 RepID=UPI003CC8A817
MSPAKSSDAGGGAQPSTGETCGSSNPTKATTEEDEEEDLHLEDEVWELRMHFHDRDNIERSMMMSDITYYNLVALMETEGYGFRDYMYYVRDPGLGIEGMEEIDDDDKLEEILDHIAEQNNKILNVTIVRASAEKVPNINTSVNVIEMQTPIEQIGEPKLYQIDDEGVLFNAENVHVEAESCDAGGEQEPVPLQFDTQQSRINVSLEPALGDAVVKEYHVTDNSEEQLLIEQEMEEKRRNEIEMFRKNKKERAKETCLNRKAAVMDNEEDSDDDDLVEYGDHAVPNKVSEVSGTPLVTALHCTKHGVSESDSLECVKLLVKGLAGADVNSAHPSTPLVVATTVGLADCIKYLLEAGADPNIPDEQHGRMPIQIAASSGRRSHVEILFPFTSPIRAMANWTVEGIIAHEKSRCSISKV